MELENRVINSSAWNFVSSLVGLGKGWDERLCVWSSVLFLRVIVTTSPPAHTRAVQSSARPCEQHWDQSWGWHTWALWEARKGLNHQMSNPKCAARMMLSSCFPLPNAAGLPWPGIWAGREWMLKVSPCWKAAKMKVCQESGRFQCRSRERIVLFGITDPDGQTQGQ